MAGCKKISSVLIVGMLLTIISCSVKRTGGVALYISDREYTAIADTEILHSDSVDYDQLTENSVTALNITDTLNQIEIETGADVPAKAQRIDTLQLIEEVEVPAKAQKSDTMKLMELTEEVDVPAKAQKSDTLQLMELTEEVDVPAKAQKSDTLKLMQLTEKVDVPDTLKKEMVNKPVQSPDILLPVKPGIQHDTLFVEVPVEVPVQERVFITVAVPVEVPVPLEVPVKVNNLENNQNLAVSDTILTDSLRVITESDSLAAAKERILISQAFIISQQQDSMAHMKEQELIIRRQRDSLVALNNQVLEDQIQRDSLSTLKIKADSLAAEESMALNRTVRMAVPDTVILFYRSGSAEAVNKEDVFRHIEDITAEKNPVAIILKGYTDRSGSSEVNRVITTQRLNLIRQALARMGIDDTIIFTQNFGSQYASETIINEERRVEIVIMFD